MSKLDIIDAFPAFVSFWSQARDKPLDAQIESWASDYMSQWPELLELGEASIRLPVFGLPLFAEASFSERMNHAKRLFSERTDFAYPWNRQWTRSTTYRPECNP